MKALGSDLRQVETSGNKPLKSYSVEIPQSSSFLLEATTPSTCCGVARAPVESHGLIRLRCHRMGLEAARAPVSGRGKSWRGRGTDR